MPVQSGSGEGKGIGYGLAKRISGAHQSEYSFVSEFKFGYRNNEDVTNLPPGVLVVGSQNVLINASDRIQVRKGYTLDGSANSTIGGIDSSYTWDRHTGDERNLRVRSDNLGIEYRYVDSSDVVTWRALKTLASSTVNFTEFWDFTTEKKGFLLFVDGSTNIHEWSGGLALIASTTVNTITISGTPTIAQLGFYTQATSSLIINGTTYTYTGVSGSTFTGVTADPTGEATGSIIVQAVKTTANSSLTSFPSSFNNQLIATLRNQVYVGSLTDNTVYISVLNNYKSYAFTAPVRLAGEGALVTLDAPPVAFISREDTMSFSAGKDQWYNTKFTLSDDLTSEKFEIVRLKTTPRQGAQSQGLVSKIKNDVVFISFEPTMDTLGRVENVLGTPQTTNISDPIKLDFDDYDFTGGHVYYNKYFIYISIPEEDIVRIYNLNTKNWEAPQILPISCFYTVDGILYGHSSQVAESYKLFDGTNDNGHPIDVRAIFSYQNYGSRFAYKSQNAFYTEGYISPNTVLTLGLTYEIDGCATVTSFDLSGSNTQFVCVLNNDASLGKNPLGKNPFGGSINVLSNNSLPPKFRWIKTFTRKDFFEMQPSFTCSGLDARFELLAFGSNASPSSQIPVQNKD